MVVKHSVTYSFLNVRDTSGYTLVFKWSCHIQFHTRFQMVGHIRLQTRFQMVGTIQLHTRFQIQMLGKTPVTHWGCTLVFKSSSYTRLNSRLQTVWTLGYMLVFNCPGNTRLHTLFQIVGTHPLTHFFSNGWDTLSYMLVFKSSGHTRLHTLFQK